jgi:hypothetical protein
MLKLPFKVVNIPDANIGEHLGRMELQDCKKDIEANVRCSPSAEIKIVDRIAYFLNISVVFLIGIFLLSTPYPHMTAVKEITYYLSVTFFLFLILYRKTDFSFKTPFSSFFFMGNFKHFLCHKLD